MNDRLATTQSVDEINEINEMDIAIVGMAGRFPGAQDVTAFWNNIRNGIESVTFFTDEELRARGVPEEKLRDPAYVKAGVLLDGMDRFDAAYFGYSPREAQYLDPQQRLFLETAVEALENAGRFGASLPERTGVYAGCSANQYIWRNLMPAGALEGANDAVPSQVLLLGNDKDALSMRVAYELDLRGPAVSVQTACSTSLVATHLACQALLNHEVDMALAGGVSLKLDLHLGYPYETGSIRSPDGHCRAFDASAAGTVSGSGVGVLVLRRLADALADGDAVLAVIKGSAINNDGAGRVGYTAPSVEGQAQVILAAQTIAGVAPDTIGYVEAHGTGTVMGDPIEVAALTQAFRAGTPRSGYCALGSVKTNIGHLDAAAGVAGVIKTVQALRHRTLPASLHFQSPNPRIDFARSPFYVNAATRPWEAGEGPRRAGVSSFGMGGTNAHVVLEEAPARPPSAPGRRWQVLPVSAKSAEACAAASRRLAGHLKDNAEANLADVAYTLQTGRKHFGFRQAAVADSAGMAAQRLTAIGGPAQANAGNAPLAFLFPGQGAQHIDMGRALYEEEPAFREIVDYCCRVLQPLIGRDLREVLFPAAGRENAAAEALAQTALTQPALFVIEYAMARCWMAWGVRPDVMLGHSVGEYVAACLANVFSLEDALRLIAARGRLMQSLPPGAMLAVALDEESLAPWLSAGCSLAAVNDRQLCVLSGPPEAIAEAEQALSARGVATRGLHVSHAFHSSMVEPVLAEFEALVTGIRLSPPAMPFISNVTGTPITAEQACSPSYWSRHLRGTVRFADGLDELLKTAGRVLLEVGPGETLSGLARRRAATPPIASQPHPREIGRAPEQMARALAQLWLAGVDIDWVAHHQGQRRQRVPLPSYPFERKSYWVEAKPRAAMSAPPASAAVPALDQWFLVPQWRREEQPAAAPAASGLYLVLGDATPLHDRLVKRLAGEGRTVVRIESGTMLEQVGTGHFRVRPDSPEDMKALLGDLLPACGPLRQVYHLWNVESVDAAAAPERVLERGYHALTALAQAVQARSATGMDRPLRLTVVASGLADVTGDETLCPTKAALQGPCQVIPREFAGIECQLIDVVLPRSDAEAERLVAQVLQESHAKSSPELVAFRGPHRWCRHYEHVRRTRAGTSRLKRGGVYLITGGFGGMGLAMAEHLAREWDAKLVLVGRSALPDRTAWPPLLAGRQTDMLLLQADMADPRQVEAAVAQALAHFGELHGVIHAAGVAGDGIIAGRERSAIDAVFAPKIAGTAALMAALAGLRLDFILFCSAMSAVVGNAGGADYCAANCVLDAYAARAARDLPVPVFSVNWDLWLEVGMAARRGQRVRGMTPAQGMEVMERILAGPATPQTLVSLWGIGERRAQAAAPDYGAHAAEAPPVRRQHARPSLQTAFVAPETDLERELERMWCEALGFESLGVHDSLFELGGDSLTAIQLLGRIQKQYGVTLHPGELFNAPTIATLAGMVELRLIEQIADGTVQ